jgi:hypothetical protein
VGDLSWVINMSRHRAAVAVTSIAVVVVVVAGCASSGHAGTTGGGSATPPQFLAYANCMRLHGVPNYADTGPSGDLNPAASGDAQSPAFVSAQHSCQKLLPAPVGHDKPTERQWELAVAFSACVRAHGLPQFPDPTLSVPSLGSGDGIFRAGMYWPLPAGTVVSPAFRRAATACGWEVGRASASPA